MPQGSPVSLAVGDGGGCSVSGKCRRRSHRITRIRTIRVMTGNSRVSKGIASTMPADYLVPTSGQMSVPAAVRHRWGWTTVAGRPWTSGVMQLARHLLAAGRGFFPTGGRRIGRQLASGGRSCASP